MFSFFRISTPLFMTAMTGLLLGMVPDSSAQLSNNTNTNFTESYAACPMEFTTFATCLSNRGVNESTYSSSVTATCQACFSGSESLSDQKALQGKSCSEIQPLIDKALVGCQDECKLDGCTNEITKVMSCIVTNNADCKASSGAAVYAWTIMLVAATLVAMVIVA